MAPATITIKRTIIEGHLTGLSGCLSVIFNCGSENNDLTIDISHDADSPLTVTMKGTGGRKADTVVVQPGKTHTLKMEEGVTIGQMNERIQQWTYAFADGRAYTVKQETARPQADGK